MNITKFSWASDPDSANYSKFNCDVSIDATYAELKFLQKFMDGLQTPNNRSCAIEIRDRETFLKNLMLIFRADSNKTLQDRIDKMVMYDILADGKE